MISSVLLGRARLKVRCQAEQLEKAAADAFHSSGASAAPVI